MIYNHKSATTDWYKEMIKETHRHGERLGLDFLKTEADYQGWNYPNNIITL